MLEAGVHFGHRVQRWNPRMAPFIYGQKNGVHIIDILKTTTCLQQACNFLQDAGKKSKTVLFVGTKRPAAPFMPSAATECQGFYVNHRWLGGFLTNWTTMRQCIQRLRVFDKGFEDGNNSFSKNEIVQMTKQRARLEKFFGGVKEMEDRPDLLVIVGQNEEMNAVREAQKLGLPTVTLVDTDCNPDLAEFPIPANDDSVHSIQFVLQKLVQSFLQGKNLA